MANYYIHLGFDWNSYLIGSVWGSTSGTNRWLQYALTTNPSGPAWGPALFQFEPNDTLSFRIWCLTSLSNYTVTGNVAMNALESDPATGIVEKYTSRSGLVDATKSASLVWEPGGAWLDLTANMAASSAPSPWGRSAGYSTNTIGPMTLLNPNSPADPFNYKLNFELSVTGAAGTRVFISDPETRIGSGVRN